MCSQLPAVEIAWDLKQHVPHTLECHAYQGGRTVVKKTPWKLLIRNFRESWCFHCVGVFVCFCCIIMMRSHFFFIPFSANCHHLPSLLCAIGSSLTFKTNAFSCNFAEEIMTTRCGILLVFAATFGLNLRQNPARRIPLLPQHVCRSSMSLLLLWLLNQNWQLCIFGLHLLLQICGGSLPRWCFLLNLLSIFNLCPGSL